MSANDQRSATKKSRKKKKKNSTSKGKSKRYKKSMSWIVSQDDEKSEGKSNDTKPCLQKPHNNKFIEVDIADINNIYKNTKDSNILNEIANISSATMKKHNLESSLIYIENTHNTQYSDVLSLIECKTDHNDRIFLNKTVMTNLHLKESDKVKIQIIPNDINQNDKFREAAEIKILPFEDRKNLPASRLFHSYLKPYFQPKASENRNYIVKKRNILFINEKKFQIIDFKLKINDEKEDENDFDFCMITNSTKIICEGLPLKNRNEKESNSAQLMVKDVTDIAIAAQSKYNTMVLLTKYQMNRLCINDSDIIVVKGKKGKIRYCRAKMYDTNSKSENNCIYLSEIMKSNLRVDTNDSVSVLRNRVCKRMKFASRIYVTAILGDDIHHNDDYNDANILLKEYLEPYFKPNKTKDNNEPFYNVVIGEDYIFKIKGIEFMVLEIETNEDDDCQYAIVNGKTYIEIDDDGIEQDVVYNIDDIGYDDIGDCSDQIEEIKYIIHTSLLNPTVLSNFGQKPETGVLFYGPPGTGKTCLAKAIANETNLTMFPINGPDIISSEMGESERKLKRAFKYVTDNAPGIVFIDEIDSILKYNNIKSALISLMDGFNKNKGLLVIGATNKINKIDVSLRRSGLFGKEVRFNVPNEKGREDILNILTRKMRSNMDNSIQMSDIAKKTHGFVGADLNQLCQTAAECAIKECSKKTMNNNMDLNAVIMNTKVSAKHWNYALSITNPSSVKDVIAEKPNVTWDDIGGLKDIKTQMIQMIENPLKHGDIYELYGSAGSRGCLLWGPGNGKTYLAKAIANKCNTNFIYVKGPALLSKYMGESEQNVRELFEKARNAAPTIIFFDEIDALAPARGGGNSTTDRVVNQLLTEMDGMNGSKQQQLFYLAATNRPDLIDPALKRPGRLEQMIFIDLPDEEARYEIFRASLRKCPTCPKTLNESQNDKSSKTLYTKKSKANPFKMLAKKTIGFTGADIKGVVDRAKNMAVNHHINNRHMFNIKNKEKTNITLQMMQNAISKSRPSITKSEYQKYLDMKKKHEMDIDIDINIDSDDMKNKDDIFDINIQCIQDFIFDIYKDNTKLANRIFKFLISESAGYDNLSLLLKTPMDGIHQLCEDLDLKYGWKVRFIDAIQNKQKISQSDINIEYKNNANVNGNKVISAISGKMKWLKNT